MKAHVITVALLAAACGASNTEYPVSTTTTTGGIINQPGGVNAPQGLREAPPLVIVGDDAAARIASVRCSHEVACGNVGPGEAFPTFDVCVADVRLTHRRQLTGDACAQGVDAYVLQQCIEDMRNLPCGESSEACTRERLCR